VTVFGAGIMAPVARRLKTQINEIAKAGANFEFLRRPITMPWQAPSIRGSADAAHDEPLPAFALGSSAKPQAARPHQAGLYARWPEYRFPGCAWTFAAREHVDASPVRRLYGLLPGNGYGVDPTRVDALVHFKESIKARG